MTDAGMNVRSSPRMGGEVVRYHGWPTHRKQTVADHTFHVMRIYWHVFGGLPPAVSAYLIFHDLSEVATGDLPHPIKRNNPKLKEVFDGLEDAVLVRMIGEARARQVLTRVADVERVRMKACDLLEMWEFAQIESHMGSEFADPIIANVIVALRDLPLSDDDRVCCEEYVNMEIERFKV